MDWRGACIVLLYKGKGDKCECSNSRCISLLSEVGRLYGRVLLKRVRAGTECAIVEDQCGFRQGRGCMDQVCAIRQVCESIKQMEKMYSGHLWIWNRHMVQSLAWYVADAKSVWV